MRPRVHPLLLLLLLSLCAPIAAQRVVLPNATGGVTAPSTWTVLRTADLEKQERASDPAVEPARRELLATIAALRADDRLAQHCLFHQPGAADGQLRLVNAYSQDANVTSAELLEPARMRELADNFMASAAAPGSTLERRGEQETDAFDIGGVVLQFDAAAGGATRRLDVYVVPAGKHLQYFECSYASDDDGGGEATRALVATFDGATEADVDPTLTNMLLFGVLGAISGIGAALLRQRWRMRRMRQQHQA